MKGRPVSVLRRLAVSLVAGKPTGVSRCRGRAVSRGLRVSGRAGGQSWRHGAEGGVGGAGNPGGDISKKVSEWKNQVGQENERNQTATNGTDKHCFTSPFKGRIIKREEELCFLYVTLLQPQTSNFSHAFLSFFILFPDLLPPAPPSGNNGNRPRFH